MQDADDGAAQQAEVERARYEAYVRQFHEQLAQAQLAAGLPVKKAEAGEVKSEDGAAAAAMGAPDATEAAIAKGTGNPEAKRPRVEADGGEVEKAAVPEADAGAQLCCKAGWYACAYV